MSEKGTNMRLLWIDLETTGLSPERDQILELAFADSTLDRPFNVAPVQEVVLAFKGRETLSPFVRDLHTKNGLLDACERSSVVLADVEDWLLAVVPEVADKEERAVLAGSTVSFDHGFLKVHMPRLAARLSYRHYDVSAVKLFCRSLGMSKLAKAEVHRAAADVRESIDHARACAEWLSNGIRP